MLARFAGLRRSSLLKAAPAAAWARGRAISFTNVQMGGDCCGGGQPAFANALEQLENQQNVAPATTANGHVPSGQPAAKPKASHKDWVDKLKPYFDTRIQLFEKYTSRAESEKQQAKDANVQISVTLPNGSAQSATQGVTTPMDVANQISKSLAKRVVVAKVSPDTHSNHSGRHHFRAPSVGHLTAQDVSMQASAQKQVSSLRCPSGKPCESCDELLQKKFVLFLDGRVMPILQAAPAFVQHNAQRTSVPLAMAFAYIAIHRDIDAILLSSASSERFNCHQCR